MSPERLAFPADLLAAFAHAARLDEVRDARVNAVRAFFREVTREFNIGQEPTASEVSQCTRLCHAVLEHRLKAAIHYANRQDEEGFRSQLCSYKEIDDVVRPVGGGVIGVCRASTVCEPPRLGDAPTYLVGTPSVTTPTDVQVDMTDAAIAGVIVAGFEPLLDSVGLVLLVHEREIFGTSNSWTTTALRGTIYSDYVIDPVGFGVELVHEAAHLWLNDALGATGNVRPSQKYFESPWKGEPRKPFGFIHAVFAFSLVTIYLKWAIRICNLSSDCRKFLTALLLRETARLVAVSSNLQGALLLVEPTLAHLISECYKIAIADAPSMVEH